MSTRRRIDPTRVKQFFSECIVLDRMVLRPLDHIRANWELSWDSERHQYEEEPDSFARLLNLLIEEIARTQPPNSYHDHEDRLGEYVQRTLNWGVQKLGVRWVGADYDAIIEQGGFGDVEQQDLIAAAAGRVWAALDRSQEHFSEMEQSHQRMLAAVLSVILYHRESIDACEATSSGRG